VFDLVHAAAILRSVARSVAERTVLSSRDRRVGGEARYGDPRAVSHRSRTERDSTDRARRRHVLRSQSRPAVSCERRGDGVAISRHVAATVDLRFPQARFRYARGALRRRGWYQLSSVSIVSAAIPGEAVRTAALLTGIDCRRYRAVAGTNPSRVVL